MEKRVSRRRLLGSIGATGAMVGTAGYSGVLGGESGIQVAGLVVDSGIEETHSIRVEINRDGDRVFEETFELAQTDEYVVREASWSTDPATYTVHTAVFGPEGDGDIVTWGEFDSAPEDSDTDCFALSAFADLSMPTSTSVSPRAAGNWDLTCD